VIRKPIRIVVKGLIVTIALVAIALGAVAWRLYLGPVDAEFAARHIRKELARSFPDLTIGIGGIHAFWPGELSGLPLRSKDLRLVGKDGGEIAHFPEVVVTVAPLALLIGEVRLESIRLVEPEIALERDVRGKIALRAGGAGSGGHGRFIAMLLDRLSGGPADAPPLDALQSIEIAGGSITISDRATRQVWRGEALQTALRRRPDGIAAHLSVTLRTSGKTARIAGSAEYRKAAGTILGNLTFDGLDPAVPASVWKPLAALEHLKLPLSGKISFAGSDAGRLDSGALEIEGGAGTITIPGVYRGPVRVKSMHVSAALKAGAQAADIRRFQVVLGDTTAGFTGAVQRVGDGLAVDGSASLTGFGVRAFRRLWPAKVGPDARRWIVRNVGAGRVKQVETRFRLTLRSGKKPAVRLHRLDGRFGFESLKVRLPGSFPELREARGEARFRPDRIDFRFERARVGQSVVSAGSARIGGLGGAAEKINIDGTIEGPVQDFLRLIDRKSLASVRKLGVDTASIRGRARLRLKAAFPLVKRLSLKNAAFAAEGPLYEISWPKALFGLDIARGRFDLTVGKTGFKLEGESRIAGSPARLAWQEKFGPVSKSWRRRLSVKGATTPKVLLAAGLDIRRFLSGPFNADVTVSAFDNGRTVIDGAYDFSRSRLKLPVLGLAKPPKQPARGSASLVVVNGRLAAVSRFALQSSPVTVKGKATLEKNGRTLRRLILDRLATGRTNLSAVLERRTKAGRRLRLTGKSLDLAPFLKEPPAKSKRAGPVRRSVIPVVEPLDIGFKLDRLFVSKDLPLWSAAGSARHDGKDFRRLRLAAALPSGKSLSLRLTPVGGGQTIAITSDDGGGALRALGIVGSLRGGLLSIQAVRRPALKDKPISGTLKLKRFDIERAPAVARFFAAAERRRIDGSIRMQRLEMKFDLEGDRLLIRSGQAYSSLVGVTASGRIDRKKRDVRLRGTLVPLYALNSVFGKVPIIGDLLIGEKGSGLLAAHFTVKGTLDKPRFNVNPVSLLTPGAIRRIFDFGSAREGRKGKPK